MNALDMDTPEIELIDFEELMNRIDALTDMAHDAERRGIRVETRLCKLMKHNGLDEQGNPTRKQS